MEKQVSGVKNCPFCGAVPLLYRSSFSEKYRIQCSKGCGAQTAPHGWQEKAIEYWNKRTGEKDDD